MVEIPPRNRECSGIQLGMQYSNMPIVGSEGLSPFLWKLYLDFMYVIIFMTIILSSNMFVMSSNTTLLCHTLQVPLTPDLTMRIFPTPISDGNDYK